MSTYPNKRRDHAMRAAHHRLRAAMIDALLNDPERLIPTPSYSIKAYPAMACAVDTYYTENRALLRETLLIVAQVARGDIDYEGRLALYLRANALIAAQAQCHAADHRDALVESERDGRNDEERAEDARDNAIDWREEQRRENQRMGVA